MLFESCFSKKKKKQKKSIKFLEINGAEGRRFIPSIETHNIRFCLLLHTRSPSYTCLFLLRVYESILEGCGRKNKCAENFYWVCFFQFISLANSACGVSVEHTYIVQWVENIIGTQHLILRTTLKIVQGCRKDIGYNKAERPSNSATTDNLNKFIHKIGIPM